MQNINEQQINFACGELRQMYKIYLHVGTGHPSPLVHVVEATQLLSEENLVLQCFLPIDKMNMGTVQTRNIFSRISLCFYA